MARSGKQPAGAARAPPVAQASRSGSSAVPVLASAVVVLAIAAVFVNHDLWDAGGLVGDDVGSQVKADGATAPTARQGGAAEKDAAGAGCDAEHRAANAHFRAGRIQHGLEELMACAKKNPDSALVHWDVGVQLSKLKDYTNALSWMDEAMALNDSNAKFFSGGGLVARRAGQLARSKRYYERCLEVLLRLTSGAWGATLLNSVSEHEADMVWIVDESPDALDRLESLLFLYIKLQEFVNANAAFKVLTKLRPERHDLHRQYSDFLAGQGLVLDATSVLMADLRVIVAEKYTVHTDSYGFANLHGLLYLAGGLDGHYINIGRTLLSVQNDVALNTMRTNCKLAPDITVRAGGRTVASTLLRGVLARCLDEQGVVARLLDTGASTDITNGFKFAPLHYAALFGSGTFLKAVLDAKPMLDMTTSLGHTAVHLAAMRGHVHLLPQLYLAGVPKESKDRRGHTVLDIACLHRYAAENITRQFGKRVDEVCTNSQLVPSVAPLYPRSLVPAGWHTSPSSQTPSACDIDVRVGLSTEDFIFDYLALQRPVLIRASTSEPRFDRLRSAWSRERLAKTHGSTPLRVSPVPYGESFGLNATEISLDEYLRYMARVQKRTGGIVDGDTQRHPPDYAFESVNPRSALAADMQVPTALNPAETEIIPASVQFYAGPAGSGAPMHVHRSAYNVQVAGRKRWALLPPPFARYSKEPAAIFFATRVSELRKSGATVYECVQEPGDTLFVPGAWGHATLNIDESLGYASEFVWGGDEFSVSEELLSAEELGAPADDTVGQGITDEEDGVAE